MAKNNNSNKPQKNVDKAIDRNPKTNRREFIEKTLKMTVGAYVGMTVVDIFVGPKIGSGGMPLNAASSRTRPDKYRRDAHPGEDERRERRGREDRERRRKKEGRK